jgi:hypothetical protein
VGSTHGAGVEVTRIAALFVDPTGVYSEIPGVDVWGEDRDARSYVGPHPVVAHPPCHLWTNLAMVNYKRYGGEHNRPGNDGGCFDRALAALRRYGGVLEHPAFSHAWKRFDLPRPSLDEWVFGSGLWATEVWQSVYGHKARKRTWLLYRGPKPPAMDWSREPGTHQCGWFDRIKPTLSKREASATPPKFAKMLVALARAAG